MISVGITGGIGSGKSTAAQVFETLGVAVYRADDRGRWLTNHHPEIRREVIELFGEESFTESGINSGYISQIVFSDPDKLRALNSVIHPRVADDFDHWLLEHKDVPYTLKEAAILFETGSYKKLDRTILVCAPLPVKLDRIEKRDGLSREEIMLRMSRQWSDDQKRELADFIIENDGEEAIIPQIVEIHRKLSQV